MEINQLVKDQIEVVYKKSNKKGKEIIGVDIAVGIRINFYDDNSIVLWHNGVADQYHMTTYFRGRIVDQNFGVQQDKNSITIFSDIREGEGKMGKFEKAMTLFRKFEQLHEEFLIFLDLIH
ncbi:hypothetical protein [Aequorivita nionensis]|uniref:hypothetical protein n=1 Tax=Flavobacteriaceae TaxID=49546 RepID=UPI003965BF24